MLLMYVDTMSKEGPPLTRTQRILQNAARIIQNRKLEEKNAETPSEDRRSGRCRSISRRLLFDMVCSH